MSTLAISAARTVGSTLVQSAGQFALSQANRFIANALDNRTFEGPRLESFHVQTSRDGAPMARVYGRARLAGQVIWASRVKEHVTEEKVGGKGGPTRKDYRYTMSFAIGLCEGETLGVDRLWANGAVLPAGTTMRVYTGTEDQLPDPVISATEGAQAPAFRGTAYIVFEDFALDDYGARLPQMNAEIVRVVGDAPKLETLASGVNLIPASGEFAYATDIVEEAGDPGAARPINMNTLSGQADITQALDQLETQLPNCQNVSLVISWFGTSVYAGACEIRPGVETRERITPDLAWSVAGETRGNAYLVSQSGGHANYGGTPSDASILQAIAALKARGFAVTIYPFILMDAPGFPWRGRIAASNAADANSFFTKANGFRRFILHYASLAAQAGGVERFIIGSEMRALTTGRFGTSYPAVDQLVTLAADVKQILPQSELTYAADWSEYFGHHEGADVTFHLDPLWSSPNIAAVGIDAYFPLSDWRDGTHLDQALSGSPYDLGYLKSQMEGGEGYDYYYASAEDRVAQIRTPITDWVYRYKDIRSWRGNAHYNRVNGQAVSTPTDWMPDSKPIWLTEIGCPAVDKGANQPNVFYDPKSDESFFPYFSNGQRDDLMQRCYLEAFIEYWKDDPVVDMAATHIWCWDARPFPDFPARTDVWTDGPNWSRGHWLSGRTGLVPLADVVNDLCAKSGVTTNTDSVAGLVSGYVIDRPMSTRNALTPLAMTYGFNLTEGAEDISFVSFGLEDQKSLSLDDLASPIERVTADSEARLRDVRVHYIDAARDYQIGLASARDLAAETVRVMDIHAPVSMDASFAKTVAEGLLARTITGEQALNFTLSPSRLDINVGDILTLPELDSQWQVESLDGLAVKQVSARRVLNSIPLPLTGPEPAPLSGPVPFVPRAQLIWLDLPGQASPLVGAMMHPFSQVSFGDTALTAPVAAGALLTDLPLGPAARWDYSSQVDVQIARLDLAAVDDAAIFAGKNQFAIETAEGWEIIAARDISLTGQNTYRLKTLLRGLSGSVVSATAAGARIVWLGRGLEAYTVNPDRIGETLTLTGVAGGRDTHPLEFAYKADHLKPLAPVHGKAVLTDTHLTASWIRQTREGGDNWAALEVPLGESREFYRVQIVRGGDVLAELETNTPSLSLALTAIPALNPGDDIHIAQGSEIYGYGAPLSLLI